MNECPNRAWKAQRGHESMTKKENECRRSRPKMNMQMVTRGQILCGYADLMMEKLIPVRRTSCRILTPYSFASLMISSLRSRLYN